MRAAAGKLKYSEIKPGAFDPKARLEEVAIDDIQQSVVYPTLMLGLPGFPDAEFAEAQARAYNRWVAEYCGYAPTRLFGVARDSAAGHRARRCRVIKRGEGARAGRHLHAPEPERRRQVLQRRDVRADLVALRGARPDRRLPSLSRRRHARRLPQPAPLELSRARRLGRFRRGDEPEPDHQPAQHLLLAGAVERLRHDDDHRDDDRRRRARAPPEAALHLPRGQRRLDRAVPRAPRPPLRDLRLGRAGAEDEAVATTSSASAGSRSIPTRAC